MGVPFAYASRTRLDDPHLTSERSPPKKRTTGRVGLPAPECGEDRVARVLLRPHDGEAARIRPDLVPDLPGR